MEARTRCDRAAAGVLAVAGLALLTSAAVDLARALPDLLGAGGEHMAGDATLGALLVVVPQAR